MKPYNIEDIQAVHVDAKRWFKKSEGNTYHSVNLSFLLKDRKSYVSAIVEPFAYGYDRQYEQTALEMFYQVVDIPEKQDLDNVKVHYLQTACQMLGIVYSEDVQDVSKRSEM